MKLNVLSVAALAAMAALPVAAQESRQDVSLSGVGFFPPSVSASNGNNVSASADKAVGALASYRFDLTPRSGLEVNYSYQQTQFFLSVGGGTGNSVYVHSRVQEMTGAYVYSLNFRKWNPFVEAGGGGFIFSPIKDSGTTGFNPRQNTNIGALYGAGVAYEISPSFDIRAEYRGFVVKIPDFNITTTTGNLFQTNRYENFSAPSLGVAYHF